MAERGKLTVEQTREHRARYQEKLIEQKGLPIVKECPQFLGTMQDLLERRNKGEVLDEKAVLQQYFEQMAEADPEYFKQIENIADRATERFPEMAKALPERSFQIVVPAYREGESIGRFLELISEQKNKNQEANWGVTIVLNYAMPYPEGRDQEYSARLTVEKEIDRFLEENPEMKPHLNYFFYYRRENPKTPMLPVALSRKVGEDTLMLQRLRQSSSIDMETEDAQPQPPLYLGMMDMDTGNLSPGIFDEMATAAKKDPKEPASIIRTRGSFDREDVKKAPYIYPLEMMWEGVTSAVGRYTDHNPFVMGRLSGFPARELALTGGCLVGKLAFPDEDIRHGIQIAWQMNDVKTNEVEGSYSTSARREVNTVQGLAAQLEHNGGKFDLETMEIAALIRMYGSWGKELFRGKKGMGGEIDNDIYENPEKFKEVVPTQLIETTVNAFYRFTLFSMYAVDGLSKEGGLPAIAQFRKEFLEGKKAYFEVQLDTLKILREVFKEQPEEFERIKPLLAEVDQKAREAVSEILQQNHVTFTIDESVGPIYGILEEPEEGQDRDKTPLKAPFKILPDQPDFAKHIQKLIQN